MSDVAAKRSSRPRLALGTVFRRMLALTAALTVAIGAGLSIQLAAGHDPALGPKLEAQRRTQQSTANGVATTSQANAGVVVVPTQTATPVQTAPAPAPVQTSTS
jgi:hypothetical protein